MKILMVAAENDALPGGKVGGIGDVVRDIPKALVDVGQHVDVIIPSYGSFSKLSGAKYVTTIEVSFGGKIESIDVFKLLLEHEVNVVNQWVLHHPLFAIGGEGAIYCDDPSHRPFATDATKFALFSAAVAKAVINDVFGQIDILHLHDWHAAIICVLREYDPEYQALQSIKCVYTIHNLALQGIRPIKGDESSLKAWFPDLDFKNEKISDPRYHNCFNPVRAGINLCDKVHAVSPTYAKEILLPSRADQGYFGGEGLEYDLLNAAHSKRLFGILNGCEYPLQEYESLSFDELISFSEKEVLKWISTNALVDKTHLVAITRIKQLLTKTKKSQPIVLTSVGRITDQKVRLFQQVMPDGKTALEHLLTVLSNDGVFILLGSGDTQLEGFLTDIATRHSNFLFLKGYSQGLSEKIYCSGDLFLMPSSFEPCGISQMLSMRAGQPCLAHNVGGLADTIIDDINGFTFIGATPLEQASNMLMYFENILAKKKKSPKKWAEISKNAMNERFLWRDVAQDYVKYLYS